MKKVSTLNELKQIIGHIMLEEANFFSPIKDMDDNLNIFKVYDRAIEIICENFDIQIALTEVPLIVKFDLVIFVVAKVHGNDAVNGFLEKIYTTPFDTVSKLLTEVKKDYKVCTVLSTLGCLTDQYEWPYHLLHHMYESINDIPKTDYQLIIHEVSCLLDSISGIIQKKLYNDTSNLLNQEVTTFTFAYMQIGDTKKEETVIYKRLSAEYPEILKVYEQAVQTLKRLQTRNSILS